MAERVLVVDDRPGIRTFIAEALEGAGYETVTAADGHAALEQLRASAFHLMITDLKMPRMDGMELLEAARAEDPDMEVIVLTAHGTIDSAVEAMKLGAFDYLTKPLSGPDELRLIARRAIDHRRLRVRDDSPAAGAPTLVAVDPAMVAVKRLIEKVATTEATVLLLGESGTGKEVAALEIHRLSRRGGAPFVPVNCAAISPQLVESEMFGHERGAFTGAVEQRRGRFEAADGGTLFLDEVGELALELQAKLLRVLQERQLERVGGTKLIEVDVRVVAATNRKLEEELAAGRFREDLYHRLSVFPIVLPPLRERPADVLPLAAHLLAEIGRRVGRPGLELTPAAAELLMRHAWPGNVRELGNTLERAAILTEGTAIDVADLDVMARPGMPAAPGPAGSLKEIERQAIKNALAQTNGHRKNAAELLGIGLRTLYNKIKEYGLE